MIMQLNERSLFAVEILTGLIQAPNYFNLDGEAKVGDMDPQVIADEAVRLADCLQTALARRAQGTVKLENEAGEQIYLTPAAVQECERLMKANQREEAFEVAKNTCGASKESIDTWLNSL